MLCLLKILVIWYVFLMVNMKFEWFLLLFIVELLIVLGYIGVMIEFILRFCLVILLVIVCKLLLLVLGLVCGWNRNRFMFLNFVLLMLVVEVKFSIWFKEIGGLLVFFFLLMRLGYIVLCNFGRLFFMGVFFLGVLWLMSGCVVGFGFRVFVLMENFVIIFCNFWYWEWWWKYLGWSILN